MSRSAQREDGSPYAFEPYGGTSYSVSTTSAGGALALPSASSSDRVPNRVVITVAPGGEPVHVKFGYGSTPTATANDQMVLAGSQVSYTIPVINVDADTFQAATHVAVVTRSSTAFVQVSTGWGI
jgi:hypothetical protein